MKRLFIAALIFPWASPWAGPARPCAGIEDDTARLACYDSQTATLTPDETDPDTVSAQEQRIERDALFANNRFVLLPHKPTYILPYTYNRDPNQNPYRASESDVTADTEKLDHAEAKFQLSIKAPLYNDLLMKNSTLWFGYSQLSLWQMYNSSASKPFRETNYEPEIFWTLDIDDGIWGVPVKQLALGVVHQSNGRGGELSRSWNRAYANITVARGRWSFSLKPWYRFPEDEDDDDNPDIDDYLGYGDFIAVYKWHDMTASTLLRNNLRSNDNLTSTTFSLSFPLPGRFRGYVEYVNGYGETLIDYNYRNKRIGFGFILNDWF